MSPKQTADKIIDKYTEITGDRKTAVKCASIICDIVQHEFEKLGFQRQFYWAEVKYFINK